MARNRVYTVHVRAWSTKPDREAVFVREGFSWPAFFFVFIWALWRRLWMIAVLLLGASATVGLIGDFAELDPVTDVIIAVAISLLVGWEANDWYRRDLERRGYVNAGVVTAPNLVEAERRFFDKQTA
jgi:hypothetical protein